MVVLTLPFVTNVIQNALSPKPLKALIITNLYLENVNGPVTPMVLPQYLYVKLELLTEILKIQNMIIINK